MLYSIDALKIIRGFRNRDGNSKEDIDAFDVAIRCMIYYIKERNMFLDGYIEGFEKAKELYSQGDLRNENK